MELKDQQNSSELNKALDCLSKLIMDCLPHGFFTVTISCEIVNNRKRRVIIEGGKSHLFIISEEDLKQANLK